MARLTRTLVVATAVVLTAASALAQFGFGGGRGRFYVRPNISYDGKFTFVRVKYQTAPGGYWYSGWPSWGHGYPLSEQNLMNIMKSVSYLDAHVDEINTLTLDDPEIYKYPVAYLIEPGWWQMTESEAVALRDYIQKGGFVIVDDFKPTGWQGCDCWAHFEANMRQAMPEARLLEMDVKHPIFHSFFEIASLEIIPQAYNSGPPVFRGVFEDNDRTKRLQMIVNYNTDISQFWEWSSVGLRPIDQTNEAYKLGVNYIVYGMTH
jgi:hypothetical protein